MISHLRVVVIFAWMFLGWPNHLGQAEAQQKTAQYGPVPADLANALVQMAHESQVPLVAELVWPLPHVHSADGTPVTKQTLDQLVEQAPDYEWSMEGRVLHFYNKKLRQARFNFLNCNFTRFTVPPNLSEFKLWFPTRAIGLLEGFTGDGAAISGFPEAQFQKQSLQPATLDNVSALRVLLDVANEAPMFYTLLTFPSGAPTKEEAKGKVNWQWGSLDEGLKPIYTQPPGSRMIGEGKNQ